MKTSLTLFAVLSSFFLDVQAANAAIIEIYEGVGAGELRSDWEAAVDFTFDEEDFSDGIWQGVTATASGGGHFGFGVSGGNFNDRLTTTNSTEFVFDVPINAFGANWDLSPGGSGLGIAIEVEGVFVVLEIPNSFTGEFFGFISDVTFTSLILTAGTQGGFAETFDLDNVVITDSTPDNMMPVPEPSTMILLCVVAFGLVTLKYLRKQEPLSADCPVPTV